jgi:hypothetical protein
MKIIRYRGFEISVGGQNAFWQADKKLRLEPMALAREGAGFEADTKRRGDFGFRVSAIRAPNARECVSGVSSGAPRSANPLRSANPGYHRLLGQAGPRCELLGVNEQF